MYNIMYNLYIYIHYYLHYLHTNTHFHAIHSIAPLGTVMQFTQPLWVHRAWNMHVKVAVHSYPRSHIDPSTRISSFEDF